MRKIIILAIIWLSNLASFIVSPLVCAKLYLAYRNISKVVRANGEKAPIFALTIWGLKNMGGGIAAPVPMLGKMLIAFQPSMMKLLSNKELTFTVAHEVGHCVGVKNKAMFLPYLDPTNTPLIGGMAGRAEEVEADIVAGKLLKLSKYAIVNRRRGIHRKVMPVVAAATGLSIESQNLILNEQIKGVKTELGL